jgi:hypothetical protein
MKNATVILCLVLSGCSVEFRGEVNQQKFESCMDKAAALTVRHDSILAASADRIIEQCRITAKDTTK